MTNSLPMETYKRLVARSPLARTGPVLGVWTALLTATFLGVVGLASGTVGGLLSRLPLYVLGSAVTFVGILLVLDHTRYQAWTVLVRAVGGTVAGFVLSTLAAEGVIYTLTSPESVVASHLFVYLLSAALVTTGLWYWSVRNWSDVNTLVQTRGL